MTCHSLSRLSMAVTTLCFCLSAFGGQSIISGEFDGSEETLPSLFCFTGEGRELGYRVIGPFQPSASGDYFIADAALNNVGDKTVGFEPVTVDVVMRMYEGSFNIHDIQQNMVMDTVDTGVTVRLEGGQSYYMLLQHFCRYSAGAYAIGVHGPGSLSGPGVTEWPAEWTGALNGASSTLDFGWGPLPSVRRTIRAERSGNHYYNMVSRYDNQLTTTLRVYEGEFNHDEPETNLLTEIYDDGPIPMTAGQDYTFIVYGPDTAASGDWGYILFPPADGPAFNYFVGGAWNNPSTAGQGGMLDLMPGDAERDAYLFLAWFTFGPISGSGQAGPGSNTQRWISAIGRYPAGGSSMELTFENTYGGNFNSTSSAITQDYPYGSAVLKLTSCDRIELEYDLPSIPETGVVIWHRSAPDPGSMSACQREGSRAGVIQ